jgi:dephospho-CoA kinase
VSARLVVGLTGGIGSGKSAVTAEFERLGVPVVDADLVAREVVLPGSDGLREVVEAFGNDVLGADAMLDRTKLRQLVFDDDAKRERLESILHPKIRDQIRDKLDAITAPYCILCVPLLVERQGYETVDRVLVIDCNEEIQIARVMSRDNLTRPQVEAIMRSQATREQRLTVADDVVDNSRGLDELRAPIAALHAKYTDIAENPGNPQ